ncbi:cytochrome P450 [Kitasatospora sp. HPMI-4]|uniref:cytochrome P450 n=1 Tax=Kitasatospora sp. HPMI-4 TaxID=3448443 RepID=UPI003F1C6D52
MATEVPDVVPQHPGTGGPPPELDASAVESWRASGGQLVELLGRVSALGGVGAVRLGPRPTVLATGAPAVQHVLARHPDRYVKRSHRARILVGDGVLSASGEQWKRQRRLLQAQFTGTGIRRFEQRIADAAHRTAGHWAECARTGRPTDVGEDLRFFALDTIWRSLTGHPLDAATHDELAAIETVVAALPTTPVPPASGGVPAAQAAVETAVAADLARIDAVAGHAIDAARRGGAGPDGPGLLHVLLDLATSRPEYTDRLIRDELVTLLVAGHETTAKTLAWLYLLLERHPEEADRALAAGAPGSAARRDAVQALVSETLRLYPPAWLLPRHAVEDDLLDGFRIEAGTDVFLSPYLTHRDPGLWPDPERFDPERFTAPGRRPAQPGAYLPFGLGARACLGLQFAMREMTVLLEQLLPAFSPVFLSTPSAAVFGFIVRPDGPMPAVITARR